MDNGISFWGAAYQLPDAALGMVVRGVAVPGFGFTVFGASGSGRSEQLGFGTYQSFSGGVSMAVFGQVLDLVAIRPLVDDESGTDCSRDMQDLRVLASASGYATLSTPGNTSNGVAGTYDFNTSVVFQAFGTDGRSTGPAVVIDQNSGDQFGTNFDFQPRLGGGWYASFGSTERGWALLAPDGNIQMGPVSESGSALSATVLADGRLLRLRGEQGLFGQLYSPSGAAQGDAFQVSEASPGEPPQAVELSTGSLAVFWSSLGDVWGRILSASGEPAGTAFRVSAAAGDQDGLTAEALPDGGCIVFWKDAPPFDGSGPAPVTSVVAQRFDAAGQKVGAEFQVSAIPRYARLEDTFSFGDGRVGVIVDHVTGGRVLQVVDTRPKTHAGTDAGDTIVGSSGGTTISGLGGNDKLYGFDGNDLVDGGSGDDTLTGAAAHDTLVGAEGNDQLLGGEGNDWLIAGAGADSLQGDAGTDVLVGGEGNDSLAGGDGFDYLYGGAGSNVLAGGGGTDVVIAEGVNDVVHTGAGNDMVYLYGSGTSTVTNESGNDVVVVVGGSVVALTGGGQDYLYGGGGNDWLSSGGGVDVLVGGGGSDTFQGGAGVDYLFLGSGRDTVLHDLQSGVDLVNGFDPAQDVIALQGTGLAGFAQVQAATSDYGSFIVVTIDAATALWLVGVRPEQLTAANFLFE